MGYVTQEQIKRAREMSALDYILSHESSAFKQVGSGYRLKEHPSLVVNDKGFYWHSRAIGGRTALDYLVNIKGYAFVDAVCFLINESPAKPSVSSNQKPSRPSQRHTPPRHQDEKLQHKPPGQHKPLTQQKPQALILPRRNKDNRRVIAYLQSRSIDRDIIMACINRGSLYESAIYHNAVFLGKDEQGKTRFAASRSTTGKYMCDAAGSDKRFNFKIPPSDSKNNHILAVFESPIEALSHMTLCKHGFLPSLDVWRLSLGGTSTLALRQFLEACPDITHCYVCTNNDEAGNSAVAKVSELLTTMSANSTKPITHQRAPPPIGNDWNNTLETIQKTKRYEALSNQRGDDSYSTRPSK